MDLGIAGKRALITGASDGLGEATARLLAREGAIVGVHGRDQQRIDGVVEAIRAEGGQAHPLKADLVDPSGADALADAALAALGQVDILVLNAGGGVSTGDGDPAKKGRWDGDTRADYAATFQLNVFSTATLMQRLAPAMKERGFGRIVLISSAAGLDPQAGQPAYGAAKGAMLNLTVSAAKWLSGSGVTINAIAPGAIMTKMTRNFIVRNAERRGWEGDFDELERQTVKQMMKIPVGRVGRPEEVAGLVGYLVGQYGGFVNGSHIRIDGGVIGTVS